MNTICQFCGASIDTPYILLGAATECPSCGQRTIPQVTNGTPYPYIGYQIEFYDFQQLLIDPAYRPSVAPLLRQWYGYEIELTGDKIRILATNGMELKGDEVRILTPDGEEINLLSLHLRIQADSAKQGTLYRTAMTLWHGLE